ncbi:hypothetical protein HK100_002953 [Physocladia obscura]|uniref:Uncharacterized protein n=1 Tax=Physocladia obscura TaxID=109957 RepID=A0AAD5XDV8_9FUNG|nr:hypothetical protein HK100_002953 [Physocladia obscura]
MSEYKVSNRKSKRVVQVDNSNLAASENSEDDEEDDLLDPSQVVEIKSPHFTSPGKGHASPVRRVWTRNKLVKNITLDELLFENLTIDFTVLKFYNLKSFDVHEWEPDGLEIGTDVMASLPGAPNIDSSPIADIANTTVKSRNEKKQYGNLVSIKNVDTSDPMGIKPSILGFVRN